MTQAIQFESDIKTLEALGQSGSTESILSVYLVTDTSLALGRDVHAQLSNLTSKLRADLEKSEQLRLDSEMAHIEAYLNERPASGRSVAIFASTPLNVFTVVSLPVRVTTGAFWGAAPYLRPLRSVIDEYEPTLVVLMDQEHARFFRMFLDDIQELSDVNSWVRSHNRQTGGAWAGRGGGVWLGGGWGDTHSQRRHDEQVHQHVRRVLEIMNASVADEGIGRILVGGTPDAISALRHLAPRPIATRIGAEITANLESSAEDVRALARSAIESLERQDEQRLVSDMIEKLGSGMASFYSDQVLKAINAQNAYVFTYIADLELSGGVCEGCGRLIASSRLATPVPNCPDCGGAVVLVPDFVDVMTARILQLGGRIEEVRGEAAEQLRSRGGVGIIHRYAVLQ